MHKFTFALNKLEKRNLFSLPFVTTHRETKQLIGFILAGFLIFILFLFLIFYSTQEVACEIIFKAMNWKAPSRIIEIIVIF